MQANRAVLIVSQSEKCSTGELDAAKEYIAFLEEQMSSQLAESKAAASAAQNEVARLNEVVAACASSSEASVRSMDATANEGTALGSSQLRQLMEQLADTELQVLLFNRFAQARRQSERRSFLCVF